MNDNKEKLPMNRRLIAALAVPMMLALGACSTNPATGQQSFTAFMSKEKEIQVGAEEHPKILEQFGGAYDDRELAIYVRSIGENLAARSEMPDLPWTFTLLNDSQVNAFALPGGYVYVTRGLMALASDEAELAGVLGHEIGHVTARHTAQRYSSSVAATLGVQVLGVLSQAAGLGSAGGDIAALGANLALKSYSREQELESDMLGVRYMKREGYDPQAVISFFAKLRAQQAIEAKQAGQGEAAVDQHNLLATHPRTVDRIEQAIDLAENGAPGANRRDAETYLSRIDGLVFGDDPKQGVIRGQAFIHPDLNFRFDVPEGFTLHNSPSMVAATDGEGAVIKFAGVGDKAVEDAGGMRNFLINAWGGPDFQLGGVEAITINGMPAYTGAGRARNKNGQVIDVRRVIIEQGGGKYWRFQFETPASRTSALNEAFRRTTYSFDEPTRSELADAEPQRVRVVEVGRGVSVQNLIDSMAVEQYKADWFEALNNIAPGDTVRSGQKVKIVK